MVLLFDASLTTLYLFSPILVLQICVSVLVFFRTDFRLTSMHSRTTTPVTRIVLGYPGRRFYWLCLIAMIVAAGIVCVVSYHKLSYTSLYYNLLWALLLPVALYYFFYLRPSAVEEIVQTEEIESEPPLPDAILLILCTTIVAFNLFGMIPITPDDGFYVGIISSTLASPDLPIQGRDFMLNTSAPFTLHPAYRTSGYEVLIAFVSNITGIDPLHLFVDIFPIINLIFWAVVAYVFMRSLGTPYPGFAVSLVLIALLFWTMPGAPGAALAYLCWGKHLLMLVAAPLLYVSVPVFIRQQRVSTWLFLLLTVSSAGVWSTSALFLVPMCVAISCIIFLPSIKTSLRTVIYVFLSLTPIILLTIYTLIMLSNMPGGAVVDVFFYEGNDWYLKKLHESLFGDLKMQSLLLVLLFLLPLIGRTTGNSKFQVNLYKICLVGIFMVMAPYAIEVFSFATNTQMLADRYYYSLPIALLVGIPGSIALAQIVPYGKVPAATRFRSSVIALTIVFYGFFFAFMGKQLYIFGVASNAIREFSKIGFEEAKAVRALIPDGSFVAAGVFDSYLPVFPNPPTFVSVRMTYLSTHKSYLAADEYRARIQLSQMLRNCLPRKGQDLEVALEWIISTSQSLGVTSMVFPADNSLRPFDAVPYMRVLSTENKEFIEALTAELRLVGYNCTLTPSGRSTVCNQVPGASSNRP